MTRQEYEYIQERLSAKLHSPPTNHCGYQLNKNEREGFKTGVLSAKSILKEIYYNQKDKELIE